VQLLFDDALCRVDGSDNRLRTQNKRQSVRFWYCTRTATHRSKETNAWGEQQSRLVSDDDRTSPPGPTLHGDVVEQKGKSDGDDDG